MKVERELVDVVSSTILKAAVASKTQVLGEVDKLLKGVKEEFSSEVSAVARSLSSDRVEVHSALSILSEKADSKLASLESALQDLKEETKTLSDALKLLSVMEEKAHVADEQGRAQIKVEVEAKQAELSNALEELDKELKDVVLGLSEVKTALDSSIQDLDSEIRKSFLESLDISKQELLDRASAANEGWVNHLKKEIDATIERTASSAAGEHIALETKLKELEKESVTRLNQHLCRIVQLETVTGGLSEEVGRRVKSLEELVEEEKAILASAVESLDALDKTLKVTVQTVESLPATMNGHIATVATDLKSEVISLVDDGKKEVEEKLASLGIAIRNDISLGIEQARSFVESTKDLLSSEWREREESIENFGTQLECLKKRLGDELSDRVAKAEEGEIALKALVKDLGEAFDRIRVEDQKEVAARFESLEARSYRELEEKTSPLRIGLEDLSSRIGEVEGTLHTEAAEFFEYAKSIPDLLQGKLDAAISSSKEGLVDDFNSKLKEVTSAASELSGHIEESIGDLSSELIASLQSKLEVGKQELEFRLKEVSDGLSREFTSAIKAQDAVVAKEVAERFLSAKGELSLRIDQIQDKFSERFENLLSNITLRKQQQPQEALAAQEIKVSIPEPEQWCDKTWPIKSYAVYAGGLWYALRTTDKRPGPDTPDWLCVISGVAGIDVNLEHPDTLVLSVKTSNGKSNISRHPLRLPRHVGKWEEHVQYQFNQEVAWDNCTWIWTNSKESSNGARPGKTSCWGLVSKGERGRTQKGEDGAKAVSMVVEGEELATYMSDGAVFRVPMPVKVVEVEKKPHEGRGVPMERFLGEFQDASFYFSGDVVRFDNHLWLATMDTTSRPSPSMSVWVQVM